MNEKIKIVLTITDSETVDSYKDVDESFIADDLLNGNLMSKCCVDSGSKLG